MKVLRYLIFISILIRLFFVIYRQSDEKLWVSLKIVIISAAILAGLIPSSVEAIEHNNNMTNNSLNEYDQQIILVRNNSSSSTVRPGLANGFSSKPRVNRPAGASGLKSVKANPVSGFRTPRGLITGQPVTGGYRSGTRLGGAGNPSGGASSDDQCPVPKIKQFEESYDYTSHYTKKKKSLEQCELDEKIEIVYKIKENPALVREAERMGKDSAAQKDVNNLIEQLSLGNDNSGIGNRRVKSLKNVSEARGRNGGRVYFRKNNGKIEILAKSNKDNQNKVIRFLQKMGY